MNDSSSSTVDPKLSTIYQNIALSVLIGLFIFTDQLSKWLMTELVIKDRLGLQAIDFFTWIQFPPEKLNPTQIFVTPYLNFVMVWNEGVSFGMLDSTGSLGPLILSSIAILIAFGLFLWMLDTKNLFQGLCLAMVIGGAFGNIIDRLRFDAVIDFLDFHIASYHWPAFNMADMYVVTGVVLLLIHSLFLQKNDP